MGDGFDRRRFLRGLAGAAAVGTFADSATGQALVTRRMLFWDTPRLSPDYEGRIVLVTNRREQGAGRLRTPALRDAEQCGFDDPWPPDALDTYRGLVVEWRGGALDRIVGGREVRAQKIVRRDLYVERRETPLEIGTTLIVSNAVSCPGDLVGVELSEVPGLRIKTGSASG